MQKSTPKKKTKKKKKKKLPTELGAQICCHSGWI
jgi:hypothetical protein